MARSSGGQAGLGLNRKHRFVVPRPAEPNFEVEAEVPACLTPLVEAEEPLHLVCDIEVIDASTGPHGAGETTDLDSLRAMATEVGEQLRETR